MQQSDYLSGSTGGGGQVSGPTAGIEGLRNGKGEGHRLGQACCHKRGEDRTSGALFVSNLPQTCRGSHMKVIHY